MSLSVGIIGDGCVLTTGFARVIRHCAAEFVRRGWDVWQIAGLDTPPACDSRLYHDLGVRPYFPSGDDPIGYSVLGQVLRANRPDVLFLNCDPGTAQGWLVRLRANGWDGIPTVLYAPVEGAPVWPGFAEAFRTATRAYTYTAWSAGKLRAEHGLDIPWVYHGVERRRYRPRVSWERKALRERFGWEGRFVVMAVARNNGRKGHDRLIKAMSHLRAMGVENMRLYLHCRPFDNHALQGTDLALLAHYWGVSDLVEFAPLPEATRGAPEEDLAERYSAADLYVSASKVEGFGLPLVEAMASGLPIIIPADGGNQEEVCGDAALVTIEPCDWDTWHTGAQLACLAPADIAKAVQQAHDDQAEWMAAAGRGLRRARAFGWAAMAGTLADAVAAAAAPPVRAVW